MREREMNYIINKYARHFIKVFKWGGPDLRDKVKYMQLSFEALRDPTGRHMLLAQRLTPMHTLVCGTG